MNIVFITADEPFPVIYLMEERPAYLIAITCGETENSKIQLIYGMDSF
ncbi:MAG: hypothetical protein ACOX6L_00780 [Syntrophomonadaceae bacterium]|jgi:hypothetical protein